MTDIPPPPAYDPPPAEWFDADGRELSKRDRAVRWIAQYHARTGEWPKMREVTRTTGVGLATASRAMRRLLLNRQ